MSTTECDQRNTTADVVRAKCSMDLDWLKKQLERPGYSQRGLAAAMGLDPAAVSRMLRGRRKISTDEVPVIEAYLGVASETQQTVHVPGTSGREPLRRVGAVLPALLMWKAANGDGGRLGAFVLSRSRDGEAYRPDFLEHAELAFATKVVTKDNEPVYRLRDTILVNPEDTPDDYDDCVFTSEHDKPGSSPAVIAQLVRSTLHLWIIHQYAHKGERELSRKDFPKAWRIVGRYHRK